MTFDLSQQSIFAILTSAVHMRKGTSADESDSRNMVARSGCNIDNDTITCLLEGMKKNIIKLGNMQGLPKSLPSFHLSQLKP